MADEVKDVKVKVESDKNLASVNAKLYKKAAKESQEKAIVNGKEKIFGIKLFKTTPTCKGVTKRSLVSISKKGKKIG